MGWSFTMSKIPSDDILESLYKLRIRESAQLKTVLELYDMDIHQKNIDAQSPKIEDNGEKEYRSEATITKFRRQKRENWVRSSGQESQGIKWRWRWKRYLLPVEKKKANVRRKTSAVSGMRGTIVHKNRHQMPPHFLSQQWHEVEVCRGKEVSRAKVILVSFLDNRVDTMWKVLARNRLVSIGILPNVNSTKQNRDVKQGISVCSSIIRLMNTQTKSRKRATIQQKYEKATTKMQWLSWKLYLRWVASRKTGSYWILKEATKPGETRCKKSLGTDSKSTIHSVYATSSKKGPSLGTIQVKNPHQRSPYAMKFEDRSQEETQRQQRCARGKGWNLAERIDKLKEKDMATFYSPAEEWVVLAASTKEPAERKFMVDSGASTHVVSKKDLNSAELETMRISRIPSTVMTANGDVQIREEATVYVKDWDIFVTVMLLEETPAVLSLGKLCEEHGYSHHWTSGQKPHVTKNGRKIDCNTANYVPFVVPGFSTSSSTTPTPSSSTSSSQDSVFDVSRYTENPVPKEGETRCIDQQKPKTQIIMKDAKKYKAISCMTCRTGCRSSEKIGWWKKSFRATEKPCGKGSRYFQFFSWITNGFASKKWYRVSTAFLLTSRRTEIAISAWRRK